MRIYSRRRLHDASAECRRHLFPCQPLPRHQRHFEPRAPALLNMYDADSVAAAADGTYCTTVCAYGLSTNSIIGIERESTSVAVIVAALVVGLAPVHATRTAEASAERVAAAQRQEEE